MTWRKVRTCSVQADNAHMLRALSGCFSIYGCSGNPGVCGVAYAQSAKARAGAVIPAHDAPHLSLLAIAVRHSCFWVCVEWGRGWNLAKVILYFIDEAIQNVTEMPVLGPRYAQVCLYSKGGSC